MKILCVTFIIYVNFITISGYLLKKNWNSKFLRFNSYNPTVYGFSNRYTHDIVPYYKNIVKSPPAEDISDTMDEFSFDNQNNRLMNDLSIPSGCVLGTIDVERQLCMHCRQYHLMLKQNACFFEQFKQNCPFTWQMYCLLPYNMSVDAHMLRVGSKRIVMKSHANEWTRFVY